MSKPRTADTTPSHVNKILESLNYWVEDYENFSTYLQKTVKDPQETLASLNTCNCCERHTINRPKNLEVWTNTEFKNIQDTSCQCSCRHTARWICRAVESNLDVQTGSTIKDDTQCAYIGLGENSAKN
jgi:hypothetical protein